MSNVIKIILSLLAALAVFLAGWFSHAWKNRKQVKKEVKKAIDDLNKEHAKALKALKDSYEEKLQKKDEIIKSLHEIIDRLLKVLQPLQAENSVGVNTIINNLKSNKQKLYNC